MAERDDRVRIEDSRHAPGARQVVVLAEHAASCGVDVDDPLFARRLAVHADAVRGTDRAVDGEPALLGSHHCDAPPARADRAQRAAPGTGGAQPEAALHSEKRPGHRAILDQVEFGILVRLCLGLLVWIV